MKYKSRFETRVRVLEARLSPEPTIIWLADGTVHKICSRKDYVRNLFAGVFQTAHLTPKMAEDLGLLRNATTIQEPDGHLLQVVSALLNTPVDEEARLEPSGQSVAEVSEQHRSAGHLEEAGAE